jgi:CO/xanthine dehydrogenase FAD-binding subunit
MDIHEYLRPKTLDEAYEAIVEREGVPIGGGAWMRMNVRSVGLAVDLASLNLQYIRDKETKVEIGAMTTYRDLETSPVLAAAFGMLFADSVRHIVGLQMRNILSVGGTVAGRYGFSDLNTTLIALGAKLVLHKVGSVDLVDFMIENHGAAFLIEKIVVEKGAKGSFQSVRITNNDFAILNACAAYKEGLWRIAVGARPAAARLCPDAASLLGNDPKPDVGRIERASAATVTELSFGADTRGGVEYRRAVCPTLVRRAIEEVAR